MGTHLTERIVKAAEIGTRKYVVFDEDCAGFGLCVFLSGRKGFVLIYCVAGRQRRMTIGTWPAWSVVAAREEAKRLKRDIDRGEDPMDTRTNARHAPTVDELVDRYIDEHLPKLSASSAKDQASMLRTLVLPDWRSRKVTDITPTDVDRLLIKVAAGRPRVWKKPVKPIAVPRVFKSKRSAPKSPPKTFKPTPVRANRVGEVLTGARSGEARTATFDQFNLDLAIWTKQAAYTKQRRVHRVPISHEAVALIRLRGDAVPKGCRFLFPGDVPGQPVVNLKRFWERMRVQAEIPDVRIHDLRHTFASLLVSGGASLEMIGRLLGHTQIGTTQRYAHLIDSPLRAGVNAVGEMLKPRLKVVAECRFGQK